MNKTIFSLAKSRITYHKSRSILTAASIMLTTMLLAGLFTGALGILDITRKQAAARGNYHAVFYNLSEEQLEQLSRHLDVEALKSSLTFATVIYGKMDGTLTCNSVYRDGIHLGAGNLTEGRFPENADEICGPPAFFERLGAESAVGGRVTISFRPGGRGEIQTREFTICGLTDQPDLSGTAVSEERLTYSAAVSETLAEQYFTPEERKYAALLRVSGLETLSYDEAAAELIKVAADIGCQETDISANAEYLSVMCSLGGEITAAVAVISLVILFFSALVIYSIYYVSVLTDIQEFGRLKSLGAAGKQVKNLLVTESMMLSAAAIPPGLLFGYALPAMALPMIIRYLTDHSPAAFETGPIQMFSLPALVCVTAAILLTVRLSIRKPLRTAGRISPLEAVRYQESSARAGTRKGCRNVTLFKLSLANLFRNRKRTLVTILTMGLSFVLFVCLSAVLNSMSAENIARMIIPEGDFRLALSCSWDDETYPENNFDSLQKENFFDDSLFQRISEIPGVREVERDGYVLVSGDPSIPYFAEERKNLAPVSEAELKNLKKDVLYGEIDYDDMTSENGVVFTSDWLWDNAGLSVGEALVLTIYDGDRQIPLTVKISAVVKTDREYDCFILPEEVWEKLDLRYDPTSDLFVRADRSNYAQVKTALHGIAAENEHFDLYSIDEETELGKMSVNLLKLPSYLILGMIAVIGFINLINTMITSIITRKKEFAILQAVGLSDRQLKKMLSGEGFFFTAGTLLISGTVGNLFGYLAYAWAKNHHISGVLEYRYPVWETVCLAAVLIMAQLFITAIVSRLAHRESLIERIRGGE